ncbi:hypothetical protein Apa02nite_049080 [Actinoplanes palleronii]|uniref:Uncharacterized protein n=2 Tax=Actinoplanes palleronii TaxID=113570 RepID=A0ABQ4BEX3_9ACTN|nr:hypothetical protein Apa02nite_049080 [Actinoplanes palleronii]
MPNEPPHEQNVLIGLMRSEGDRLLKADPTLLANAGGWRTARGGLSCWLHARRADRPDEPSMEITIALEGGGGRYRAESDIGTSDGQVVELLQTGPELRGLDQLLPLLRDFYGRHADLIWHLAREE